MARLKRVSIWAWLPMGVGMVTVLATLALWWALRTQERANLEQVVTLATYSIRADMVADMSIRIRGLVDLARLWEISEHPRKGEFEIRSALYISHVPGCVAVLWVDPNNRVNWEVPIDGDVRFLKLSMSLPEEDRRALRSAIASRGPLITRTAQLGEGERFLPVWVPVFAENAFQGYLVGLFRVQPLLDDITADHADLGYEVIVSEDSERIYALSGSIPENRWAQQATVELPGVSWKLRIWPSAKALPNTMPLSTVVLFGGLIVASQLSLTVYLAQRERLWAKDVARANQELTTENAERRRAEESLHRLSARLLFLQDEERRRIARELHDSTAQLLYGLTMKLRLAADMQIPSKEQSRALDESIELADQAVRDIRTLSYLLHPPSLDELGLIPAWRTLAKGFTERSGIYVQLDVPDELPRLSRPIETALFRIVQEALSNIHRHSGSRTASICLVQRGGNIRLDIGDEGHGFPTEMLPEKGQSSGLGVGVMGMRERIRQLGGTFEILSSSAGTHVIVTVPVDTDRAAIPRETAA